MLQTKAMAAGGQGAVWNREGHQADHRVGGSQVGEGRAEIMEDTGGQRKAVEVLSMNMQRAWGRGSHSTDPFLFAQLYWCPVTSIFSMI